MSGPLHLLDRATKITAVNLQSRTLPLCENLVTRFGSDKALEYALTGGDDYCLLASIPPGSQVPPSGKRIGMVVKRESDRILLDGKPLPASWQLGWDHNL